MIKRIKKILKLGIFDDYAVDANFNDFARFNIFYGWNGCGKTTLSRLFSMLDKKVIHPSFDKCEFEVVLEDDTVVRSSNLTTFAKKVFVFNQHFIEENIDWQKQGAKSIVVISEEKIEERKKYLQLRDITIPAKIVLLNNSQATLTNAIKERDAFLSSSAKGIKSSYQLIDTSDRRYMNYDRTKFRTFIDDNREKLLDPASILNNEDLEQLKKKLQPVFKPKIDYKFESIDPTDFVAHETNISELLKMEVVTEVIERLKAHHDINRWVEEGLAIHEKNESDTCEFCGQELPAERVAGLKRHFNDAYTNLINQLNTEAEWLSGINIATETPDSDNVYEEFKEGFISNVAILKQSEKELKVSVTKIQAKVAAKQRNLFDTSVSLTQTLKPVFDAREQAIQKLGGILNQHNAKSETFQEQLAEDKSRIELHFAAEVLRDGEYFALLEKIEKEEGKLQALQNEVDALEKERRRLEGVLANVAKGAENFNRELHRFLGRTDISLLYDASEKGYKIIRSTDNKPAEHLSEGEKTAIAFVYFATKISENANSVEDSIIVIDDPISSFDSTYLFNSFAYLKHTCESARQLFVLTHNFQYFKLVRDWMMAKNRGDAGKKKSQAYSIEVQKKVPRQSVLSNAHHTLLNHGSEYHYFFRKLYDFKETHALNMEESFLVANFARKMLEAFFAFKHPRKRSDFYALMSAGCKAAGVDELVINRIYKFINTYSHNQIVEFHDSTADNLLGEGYNITVDVLDVIRKADKVHYDELVEMCS